MDNTRVQAIFERIQQIQEKWHALNNRLIKANPVVPGANRQPAAASFAEVLNQEFTPPPLTADTKLGLEKHIDAAAKKHGVDPNLIKAVIEVESNWRADAVSHKGAKGLMQLMDPTAQAMGVTDSFDPGENIDGGTKYLSSLLQRYDNNREEALAAYNYGPGRVKKGSGVPEIPMVKKYVDNVLGRISPDPQP